MSVFGEPVRGGIADVSMLGFPGRERLTMFGAELPYPPYMNLLGIRVVEIDDGRTVTTMPATGWLLSPQGRIPLGLLAALADTSFGTALETRLGGGILYTTSEMSLHRLATPALSGDLRAVGRSVYLGADVSLSDCSIFDSEGTLVAHGTSRLNMFPVIEELSQPPETLPAYEKMAYDTPDPYLREAPELAIREDDWESATGLEVLERQIAGDLPAAPLFHLLGLRPVSCTDGSATVSMPAHQWLTNHFASIYGGFVATLADAALQMSIQSVTEAGRQFAPLDFKVNFLRPAHPNEIDLVATGTVIHRGKTNAVASAEVIDGAGKRVAVATGAAMFGPLELL